MHPPRHTKNLVSLVVKKTVQYIYSVTKNKGEYDKTCKRQIVVTSA